MEIHLAPMASAYQAQPRRAEGITSISGRDVHAIFCPRRHQPTRPPLAKITPGSPAPAMGPGTPAIRCTSTVVNIVVSPKIVPHWPNDGQEAEKPKPTGSNNNEEPNVGPKSKSISLADCCARAASGQAAAAPPSVAKNFRRRM